MHSFLGQLSCLLLYQPLCRALGREAAANPSILFPRIACCADMPVDPSKISKYAKDFQALQAAAGNVCAPRPPRAAAREEMGDGEGWGGRWGATPGTHRRSRS